mmetsp:Transcript_19933/g.29397  ORF Transcript_19933/g.29397 Transcript_19933/m.29397 type:complete len:108 (+) Transcript_19933:298-621(+)
MILIRSPPFGTVGLRIGNTPTPPNNLNFFDTAMQCLFPGQMTACTGEGLGSKNDSSRPCDLSASIISDRNNATKTNTLERNASPSWLIMVSYAHLMVHNEWDGSDVE